MLSFIGRRLFAEKLFTAVWFVLGIAVFFAAGSFPDGAAVYPRLIAIVMMVFAAAELASRKHESAQKPIVNEDGEEDDSQETSLPTALGFFAILGGTIWLIPLVGYLIAGSIGSFLFLRLVYGENTLRAVVMTLGIIAFTGGVPLLFGIELPTAW